MSGRRVEERARHVQGKGRRELQLRLRRRNPRSGGNAMEMVLSSNRIE